MAGRPPHHDTPAPIVASRLSQEQFGLLEPQLEAVEFLLRRLPGVRPN